MTKRYVQFATFIEGVWREQGDTLEMGDDRFDLYQRTGQLANDPPKKAPPKKDSKQSAEPVIENATDHDVASRNKGRRN